MVSPLTPRLIARNIECWIDLKENVLISDWHVGVPRSWRWLLLLVAVPSNVLVGKIENFALLLAGKLLVFKVDFQGAFDNNE